ncbi:hypothetical protein A5739_14020 [Mycobacterium colombiense]|uniref:DUF262 domain-containing protein n=1 Tax=Mycobacterium colombiense TaxID=339268 RepID=UPI00096DBE33|nr:DUF262 domain-containing protein [Mycobacterium colombiense]OMC31101.1 hypothetical protein A5739_14020 [Mycobacterium colombiense]
MKKLEALEHPLIKVFSSDFEFAIPDYQRPYSWGTEQTLQLLDDLEDALNRSTDEPYFLGSIVLVRSDVSRRAEIIDGQQRLTTLSILFAIMRDLTANATLANELGEFVMEPGRITAGTEPKPRLTLRARDAQFFHQYIQEPGHTAGLADLDDNSLANDSQRAIRDNANVIRYRLHYWSEDRLQALAAMAGIRIFLVIVSTPDLPSAHRIFSVMNARGLDLSPADIFKAQVIGAIPNNKQSAYAAKWEDAEEDLTRERFTELFLHIRMVFAKERARRELLIEFPEQVLNPYLSNRAAEFVDDVLLPYAEAYEHLLNQDYTGTPEWQRVNAWLSRLVQLDNSDWRPPALWALRNHGGDPVFLDAFLRKLERLAASMLLRREYATPRAQRYASMLKSLEAGQGLDAQAFALTDDERRLTRERLGGALYLVGSVRNYVLLRLDELLANQPGVSYQHKLITVEHVLPQTPKDDSNWVRDFTDDERSYWTHRLANLVLLNRRKNSAAQRFDFDEKKSRYFSGTSGVATFALTSQVLAQDSWTPDLLEARQQRLTKRLIDEWELN